MDTIQITTYLNKNKYTRKFFRGVFPLDHLPMKNLKRPSLIIVNTDISKNPGKHWVAIFLPRFRKPVEFFDSYGRFLQNEYFNKFYMEYTNDKGVIYNKKTLQSPISSVCGYYCCVYALYRSKGSSMKKFIKIFGNRLPDNDRKITELFQRNFIY